MGLVSALRCAAVSVTHTVDFKEYETMLNSPYNILYFILTPSTDNDMDMLD